MTIRWSVYKITSATSGRSYIGITKTAVTQRWRRHINTAKRGSPIAISCAIRKYGESDFSLSVITIAWSFEMAARIERIVITSQRTMFPDGYNLTSGGEATMGRVVSPEARSRMSAAAKKRKRHKDSPETRAKKSAARLLAFEKYPYMRQSISTAQTGRKRTPEQLAAMSAVTKARAAANPGWFKRLAAAGRASRYGHPD